MIYLLLSLTSIPFLGMLYFMKKVKDGEISLSEKSWHFKLLKYMWDVDADSLTNMCPYYWSVVCSVIILPLYLIIRYSLEFIDWINDLARLDKAIKRIKSPIKEKEPKKESVPLFVIPQSKKDVFSVIWKKGINVIEYILIAIIVVSAIVVFVNFMYISFSFSFMFGVAVLTILIYALLVAISCNSRKYREIMFEPWCRFFTGIYGLASQPFRLIWQLLLKLFNVYEDLCPSINWESRNND